MAINALLQQLCHDLSIKDLGPLNFFLGIESHHNFDCFFLFQSQYIMIFYIEQVCTMQSLCLHQCPLQTLSLSNSEAFLDPTFYRNIVGALQYVLLTRLDLSYVVNWVRQYMHCPTVHHRIAVTVYFSINVQHHHHMAFTLVSIQLQFCKHFPTLIG